MTIAAAITVFVLLIIFFLAGCAMGIIIACRAARDDAPWLTYLSDRIQHRAVRHGKHVSKVGDKDFPAPPPVREVKDAPRSYAEWQERDHSRGWR